MSIGSDAHRKEHFKHLGLSIAQASRGLAERENIINAQLVKKTLNN